MTIKNKLLLILVIGLLAMGLARTNVLAYSLQEWSDALKACGEGETNNPCFEDYSKDGMSYWITNRVGGMPGKNGLVFDQNSINNSALGFTNNAIVSLYREKPADAGEYLADLGAKAGLVKPAYAQGIGFTGLSPILNLWKAFRNIAYGFLIVVMIVIGFMIMFRMHIDPRTVISIQNAIPRIIITLILITFSYAIVGLLIDLMYLLLYVSIFALSSSATNPVLTNAMKIASGGPLSDLFGATFSGGYAAVTGLVNLLGGSTADAIAGIVGTAAGLLIGNAVIPAIGGIPGLLIGGGLGLTAGSGNALLWLVVILALFIAFLRIAITLLMAYIQIIISVIFAPLVLMFGAIPNVDAVGSWIRGIIANLGVFVITSIMLMISAMLSYQTTHLTDQGELWVPPGLGGNQGAAATGLISLGIALLIPSLANSLKEILKAKPTLPIGGALGSMISTPVSGGMQLISSLYYLNQLTPNKLKEKLLPGLFKSGGGAQKEGHG